MIKILVHLAIKLLLVFAVLSVPFVQRHLVAHRRTLTVLLKLCLVLLLAGVVCGALVAAGTNRIVSHDEVSILSIAAAHRNGQVMYPTAADTGNYALLYGPVTFLTYEVPMAWGAVTTGAFQALVAACLAVTLLIVWFTLRKRSGQTAALLGAAYIAMLISHNTDYLWAVKGDAWILLCGALALCAVLRANCWLAATVAAACAAAAIDIKVTVALPAVLPLMLLWRSGTKERKASLVALFACVPLALLPFLLPDVHLQGYLAVLTQASHHGIAPETLRHNLLEVYGAYLMPALSVVWCAFVLNRDQVKQWFRTHVVWCTLVCISAIVCVLTGSKTGAGPWHLVPLAIALAYLMAEMFTIVATAISLPSTSRSDLIPTMAFSPLLALYGVSLLYAWNDLRQAIQARFHERPPLNQVAHREVERDLLAFAAAHSGSTIQMGYGDDQHYAFTYTRQVLVEKGQPLLIDADVQNEEDLDEISEPLSVLTSLRGCGIQFWLIPKGNVPFSMNSLYHRVDSTGRPEMFPKEFQQAFLDHYRLSDFPTRFFDTWVCKAPASTPSQMQQ